ncbi:MAG: hypothetical protein ABIR77_05825 [Sphingomicrobium sp.]
MDSIQLFFMISPRIYRFFKQLLGSQSIETVEIDQRTQMTNFDRLVRKNTRASTGNRRKLRIIFALGVILKNPLDIDFMHDAMAVAVISRMPDWGNHSGEQRPES